MGDFEALQGLWKIQSSMSRGRRVSESATHYLIAGNSMKEIVPSMVDDGKLRASFELDESSSPKRLTEILDYNGPDGPPDPDPIIMAYLYRLEGDVLTLCSGIAGEFPDEFSDEYSIKTLVRDHGPVPECRQPSGKPPLVDDVLGTLPWDDNLEWYAGPVNIAGLEIELTVNPGHGGDLSKAVARARQIVQNLDRYRQLAADFAVEGLLTLKNEFWLDEGDEDVTADEFQSRMTLQSISIEAEGEATFWHDDGNLFWGHSIQVSIDADDRCVGTDIPG